MRNGIFILAVLCFHLRAEEIKSAPQPEYTETTLDFEGQDVDGEFMNPSGDSVNSDQNLYFDSLIQPKKNFKNEIKRSTGAVR